jgi:hypothetical protein
MDHSVIGPIIRQRHAEGKVEGRIEGQTEILLRMIEKRFGRIKPSIRKRVKALKPLQLEEALLRFVDAERIEDLFAR